MLIEWESQLPLPSDIPLSLIAYCCQLTEQVEQRLYVHLCICDNATIHEINLSQRGVDRPTDVLSFPTVNYPKGQTAKDQSRRLKMEYDPQLRACVLGDIFISLPKAQEQAITYGHSLRRELCYLFAHGLFHLMGYDHTTEEERKEMRSMEDKAMNMAGIGRYENTSTISDENLVDLARQALLNSYSPYSRYSVGAALLCEDGRVFLGCNIENASFGLTNCAERTAIYKAISEGASEFVTIAIASNGTPPYPCGACRQVLNEFAPGIRILVTTDSSHFTETSLNILLPHGFGPKDLPEKE